MYCVGQPIAASALDASVGGGRSNTVSGAYSSVSGGYLNFADGLATNVSGGRDEALRPVGLTNGQFSLLMALNRPVPPTIRQVSEVLAMDRTTLTANLKPLERRGLVAVSVDEADKRSRRISLSAAGRETLAEALPLWQQAQEEIGRLLRSDPENLLRILRSLS